MNPAEIKQSRQAAHLSQREMGGLLHVSIKTVQAWEYGHNPMSWGYWALFRLLTDQASKAEIRRESRQ